MGVCLCLCMEEGEGVGDVSLRRNNHLINEVPVLHYRAGFHTVAYGGGGGRIYLCIDQWSEM